MRALLFATILAIVASPAPSMTVPAGRIDEYWDQPSAGWNATIAAVPSVAAQGAAVNIVVTTRNISSPWSTVDAEQYACSCTLTVVDMTTGHMSTAIYLVRAISHPIRTDLAIGGGLVTTLQLSHFVDPRNIEDPLVLQPGHYRLRLAVAVAGPQPQQTATVVSDDTTLTIVPQAVPRSSPAEVAIIQATVTSVLNGNSRSALPVVTHYSRYDGYALTEYQWGGGGGEALLRETNRTWRVIGKGGGQMNAGIIEAFGVPHAVASKLLSSLTPVSGQP